MRLLALLLISALSLASSSAFAASYQQIDGTIIDPIQSRSDLGGGDLAYFGSNLEPFANLTGADLFNADLAFADLRNTDLASANLTGANLFNADLAFANLTGADLFGANLASAHLLNTDLASANLTGADLTNAVLVGTDLGGAILANAEELGTTFGAALYDINTDFTGTGFDPVAAGWTLVPEPGTALLMGLGLAGLAARRR